MSNEMKHGVIYARYSTHNQKDVSIEQQVEACRAYAEREGIEIIEVFADRAKTGRDDDRYNFQRMMRYAEQRTFQCVIAWKSNRIGRDMLEAMINENTLEALGVRCLYTEENFDDSAAGRFAKRTMMNVNQFYSENMAEDIKRGMRDNASKALVTSKLPYGYKSGANLTIELDPPRDAIVREIFERVAKLETYADIARDLNERGVPTSRGFAWNKCSFRHIIKNERYRGVYIYEDIRIEGGIPRIVDDELYYRVQSVVESRNQLKGRVTPSSRYLLTGKIFCGECKSPMVGTSGHGKTGAFFQYYTCKGRRQKICTKANVSKQLVEDAIMNVLMNQVLTDDIIWCIANRAEQYQNKGSKSTELTIIEDQLAVVGKSIDNIIKAIEQGILTPSTKDRLLELEDEKASLEEKHRKTSARFVPITKEEIIAVLQAVRTGDERDEQFRKDLFDIFIDAVYLYDDRLTLMFTFNSSDSIDIMFKETTDSLSECSDKELNGLPNASCTNTLPNMWFVKGIFIVKVRL